jgi:hypothetical protein
VQPLRVVSYSPADLKTSPLAQHLAAGTSREHAAHPAPAVRLASKPAAARWRPPATADAAGRTRGAAAILACPLAELQTESYAEEAGEDDVNEEEEGSAEVVPLGHSAAPSRMQHAHAASKQEQATLLVGPAVPGSSSGSDAHISSDASASAGKSVKVEAQQQQQQQQQQWTADAAAGAQAGGSNEGVSECTDVSISSMTSQQHGASQDSAAAYSSRAAQPEQASSSKAAPAAVALKTEAVAHAAASKLPGGGTQAEQATLSSAAVTGGMQSQSQMRRPAHKRRQACCVVG